MAGSSWQPNCWVKIIAACTFTWFTLTCWGPCDCLPAGVFIWEAQRHEPRVAAHGICPKAGGVERRVGCWESKLKKPVRVSTQAGSVRVRRNVFPCFQMYYICKYIFRHLRWMPCFVATFITVFPNLCLGAWNVMDRSVYFNKMGVPLMYTPLDTESTKISKTALLPAESSQSHGGGRQLSTSFQYQVIERTVACGDMVLWRQKEGHLVQPGQGEVGVDSPTRIPGEVDAWADFERKGDGLPVRGNSTDSSTESPSTRLLLFWGWELRKGKGSKRLLQLECSGLLSSNTAEESSPLK